MTVQDFIVNYSETFKYLHEHHGKEAVVKFWLALAASNKKLYKAVEKHGLEGYLAYFYGEQGTCTREHLVGGAVIENGVFIETCECCPSVSALEARGKRPYRYYCEHCYWLYNHSLEDHGFSYDAFFELQPWDEGYSKKCRFIAKKREVAE